MSSPPRQSRFEAPHRSEKKRKREKGPPKPPPGPKFPDRWTNYSSIGEIIEESRFIAFKTPLSERFFRGKSNEPFGPKAVVDHVSSKGKTLGLVVDLTATTRYYDSAEWKDYGVQYEKIFCEGHTMHKQRAAVNRFTHVVKKYMSNHPGHNMIIGVHCTHGLNRTGYLICRYMIDYMGIEPEKAIQDFEEARGHRMEREAYLSSLRNETVATKASVTAPSQSHPRVEVPEAWNDVAGSNWGRRRQDNRGPDREYRRRDDSREHRRQGRGPYDNRHSNSPGHRRRQHSSDYRRRNDSHDRGRRQSYRESEQSASSSTTPWPQNPPNVQSILADRETPTVNKHPRIISPTDD